MTLTALIRKRTTPTPANANPANIANDVPATERPLAGLAELSLAGLLQAQAVYSSPAAPMTSEEESTIRAWLAHIEEIDPVTIAEVLDKCRADLDERKVLVCWGKEALHPFPVDDDRRRCEQCANLTARGLCLAAQRGEINASRIHEPVRDLLQRCIGYMPKATDTDQRTGRERWPGLTQLGGNHATT